MNAKLSISVEDLNKLEVLAPAGDTERFNSALDYGADAIYIGG